MSRRDTILVAVLVNSVLLAILFMMAINPDITGLSDVSAPATKVVAAPPPPRPEPAPVVLVEKPVIDEVDSALEKMVVHTPPVVEEAPKFLEVTVKRGDVLERIARTNGVTLSALKKANNLKGERIDVGQVLRIPVGETKTAAVAEEDLVEYYTIRSGDNPWTIAKQFHVRFNELLELNDLDEAKARNLKIGDRLRVH